MMVIRGTTTRHSQTGSAAGLTSNLVFVFESARVLMPNPATVTALAGLRITSVSALTSRVGATASGSTYDSFLVNHITFNEDNDIVLTQGADFVANQTVTITPANVMVIDSSPPAVVLYPADRCTWRQFPSDQGYLIDQAHFYDGTTAGGSPILEPALGYIGKSGRFVEIAG